MSAQVVVQPDNTVSQGPKSIGSHIAWFFSLKNRYLAPMLITMILLVGQLGFGLLESWWRSILAISTCMAFELVLGRIYYGKWPHLASSYISGISVGNLVRSPFFWPYAVAAGIATTSKYVIRWRGRHLWNPSNFAICAMLILAPDYFSTLSIQWGNSLYANLVVWCLGMIIIYRLRMFHVTATYVVSFVLLSLLRSGMTGHPFLAEVAPITGPMYQLYIFFMITDPKTQVSSKKGQILVAFLVAAAEMVLRLAQNIHAPYYALTIVGPLANIIDIWWSTRKEKTAPAVSVAPA